jgi:hypothetical protein
MTGNRWTLAGEADGELIGLHVALPPIKTRHTLTTTTTATAAAVTTTTAAATVL